MFLLSMRSISFFHKTWEKPRVSIQRVTKNESWSNPNPRIFYDTSPLIPPKEEDRIRVSRPSETRGQSDQLGKLRPRRGEQKRSSKVSGSAAGKVIRIPQPCESQQLVTDPREQTNRITPPLSSDTSSPRVQSISKATDPFTLSREFTFSKDPETVRILLLHLLFLLSVEKIFSTRV